jgi:heterotetrameric sarcosine oxidase beta subunit
VAIPGVSTRPLGRTYDAVVIGAGIQGLATAYELAKRGMRNVAVLDSSWPGGGASGRNGELIRSAFSSPEWITLFDASLKRWHQLSRELDFNVLFNPSGYLVLASTDEQYARCRADVEAQARFGLRTELLDQQAVLDRVPALNPDAVVGAVLQPAAGFAHHDAAVWGYARAAARLGVEVHPGVEVLGVTLRAGRAVGVMTSAHSISAPVVVNAAGSAARRLAGTAGVALPLDVARLEMLVTESLAPFLRPAVASLAALGYCHQTSRGEFVGGTELAVPDHTPSLNATYRLLRDMAKKFVWLFPQLRAVRVLRHWAGLVSQTPDLSPIVGTAPGVEGLYLSCGWVYGFVGAPAAAAHLADTVCDGRVHPTIAPFDAERFAEERLIREGSLVVPGEVAS